MSRSASTALSSAPNANPPVLASLALSLLKSESYHAAALLSSPFVKDRYFFVGADKGTAARASKSLRAARKPAASSDLDNDIEDDEDESAAVFKLFQWQPDTTRGLRDIVECWDPALDGICSEVLYRRWDAETLHAAVKFTSGFRRDGVCGVCVLMDTSGSRSGSAKWTLHNLLATGDYSKFANGWSSSREEAEKAFESSSKDLRSGGFNTGEEDEYWDTYDMIGQNATAAKRGSFLHEESSHGDDDYWNSYG
ncbi:hypothetical protein BJ742DRAFT_768265 [Cladochytrium replicatum]|nr:hypothetical protein BJ742DRAFT_768265 [Cladochytrium replicatum]